MSDNLAIEPANQFYKESADTEQPKPTEEAVTKQEQEPEQEAEILETPEEDTEKLESESEESESKDEVQESQYIELDGKEVDLEDVKKWRDGHMMQSDYTKKTTDLADERKTFNAERDSERENLLKEKSEVSELRDTLAVLVAEDEEIDWVELKEDDPERYIELKEKADKRKEALAKVKADRDTPADDPALIAEEQGKLYAANPEWFDDKGAPTETYTKDLTLLNEYAVKAGFTTEEFSQLTRAHHMNTILKAAKYDALQEKGREIKATREKVPVTTKPKAKKQQPESKSMADTFYSQTG
jgi:hypothetical protein